MDDDNWMDDNTWMDEIHDELPFEEENHYQMAENVAGMDLVVEHEYPEFGHLFARANGFNSRQEAQEWVYEVGFNNMMYFTITSSKPTRVYLGCEREGFYVEPKMDDGARVSKRLRKSKGTKKLDCKFQVKLLQKYGDQWYVRMDANRGKHNHKLGKYGNWHPSYTKLQGLQMQQIETLSNANMMPQPILNMLITEHPGLNLRKISNARIKLKIVESKDMNSITLLFKRITEKKYLVWDRREQGSDCLNDIVFASPRLMKLLRNFPQVVILDGTYSTNKHKLPLIEIVGVVPTGQNFHIAFAFIKNEVTDSFMFVMKALRDMYLYCEGCLPSDIKGLGVIITDRELAAMNAIRDTFPKSKHFLCTRHISVDVRKYVVSIAPKNGNVKLSFEDAFSKRWNALVGMPTVQAYEECLSSLEDEWAGYKAILNYIHKTWLDPYRERFVSCWTDEYMHYGNTTTNRVEGAHSQFKNWLGTANGSLDTCFKKIDELVELQIGEIETKFEASLHKHSHMTEYIVYRLLGGMITHKAFDLLIDEGRKKGPCTCVFPKSHDLPCKCQMDALVNAKKPIELHMISKFWRKLDMEITEEKERPSAKQVAEVAWEKFCESASESVSICHPLTCTS